MKFCPVVPEICHGQVHVPKKERRKRIRITIIITRKNCFRYLKLMSPLNAAICTTISYTL
jgi:hypothetical protein